MFIRSLLFLLCLCGLSADEIAYFEEAPEIKVIGRHEVVDDDYFAWGSNIEIAGTINGDVYIFGSQVFLDGQVNGDIFVVGGSVTLSGNVLHSARIIGGQVRVSGNVGRSATIIAGNCEITPSGAIGGNLTALCGNTDLSGVVKGSCRFYGSNLRLSNVMQKNVFAYVGNMRVTSNATIDGLLEYWSDKTALIDSGAVIKQDVIHHTSFLYNLAQHPFLKWFRFGSKLATILMNFLYSFAIGLLSIRYFPSKVKRSLEAMSQRPVQSFVTGIMVLVLLPLTCLLLLMTILGVPFALTLLAINVIGFYTAKVFTVLWVSKRLFHRFRFQRFYRWYFFLTLGAYFVLASIPYVGMAVAFAAMLFGLGSIVLGKSDGAHLS
jgi:cytoskeletal protein CcmA (bactofilin family)